MSIKPMIFNTEMVQDLLDGRKVQTRRPVKMPSGLWGCKNLGRITSTHPKKGRFGVFIQKNNNGFVETDLVPAPCAPGDLIYVRETWCDVSNYGVPSIAYRADSDIRDLMLEGSFLDGGAFNYDDHRCAKYSFENWADDLFSGVEGCWRPSIHMPRWASRLTLKVTAVRVERVQDISETDAVKEGFEGWDDDVTGGWTAFDEFSQTWFGIYGEESWNRNDWVWVIDFEVIRQNVDEYLRAQENNQ